MFLRISYDCLNISLTYDFESHFCHNDIGYLSVFDVRDVN